MDGSFEEIKDVMEESQSVKMSQQMDKLTILNNKAAVGVPKDRIVK